MTGEGQRAGALHARGLDEQHFAAGRRPREPDGYARILRAVLDLFVEKRWRTEQADDQVRRDDDLGFVSLRAPPRDLPAQRGDLALEIPDARLARVPADD